MNRVVEEVSAAYLVETAEGDVPAGYKKTEVGVIPEDWEVSTIGKVLKIRHGKSQKQVESEGGRYPILATGGQIGFANAYLYNKPSVLIGRKGTIDKPRFVEHPFWSVDTLFYSEISAGIDPKFIFYKFCEIDWRAYNEASGVPSLNASVIEAVSIGLPKPIDQQKISSLLSDVDDLIEGLEKLIAKKQAIKAATMQQLLTGRTRLPQFALRTDGSPKGFKNSELGDIPEDWQIVEIGQYVKITTGDKNTQDRTADGDYPFFVRSETVERINTYSFDGEGVLTAGDGVGTGKIFHYIKGRFDFHQRVYLMSNFSAQLDGYFFYLYFGENFFNRITGMTAKSSVDSVRREMISEMKILLPNHGEQLKISSVIFDLEYELQLLRQRLFKVSELKQGMMQQLLTGKIRLVQPAKVRELIDES